MLDFCAQGRGFDPQPAQKVISIFSPVTLHTKFKGHRPFGSREDFVKVFTIYGHGCHLGHVTWTV